MLYVTNGETTDYAHAGPRHAGVDGRSSQKAVRDAGSCSRTTRELIQAEFERNLPFPQSVVESAKDPDDPKSSIGIETKPFYINSADPYKEGLPEANFGFDYSYGDPQPVGGCWRSGVSARSR